MLKVGLTVIVYLAIVLLNLLSFLSVISHKISNYWQLEVVANFQAYYFFLHVFVLLLLIFLRKKAIRFYRTLFILQFVFILNIGRMLFPFYYSEDFSETLSKTSMFRILYANVYSANQQTDNLKEIIETNNPDLICLLETNKTWSKALNLKKTYPFNFEILREDDFGISVYSKYKLGDRAISDFGVNLNPAYYNFVEVAGRKIYFALLHAQPPLSNESLFQNKLLLRRLSSLIRFEDDSIIVLGDFNATPYSFFYRKFVEWTKLKDAFHGRGLIMTWNAKIPLLRINIDHVLYKNIKLLSAKKLQAFGSDHYPILSDFDLK